MIAVRESNAIYSVQNVTALTHFIDQSYQINCQKVAFVILCGICARMSQPPKKVKLTSWDQAESMCVFPPFGLDAFAPQRVPFSSAHTIDDIVCRLTELERMYGKINVYALLSSRHSWPCA